MLRIPIIAEPGELRSELAELVDAQDDLALTGIADDVASGIAKAADSTADV
jgi:hypothetical protein